MTFVSRVVDLPPAVPSPSQPPQQPLPHNTCRSIVQTFPSDPVAYVQSSSISGLHHELLILSSKTGVTVCGLWWDVAIYRKLNQDVKTVARSFNGNIKNSFQYLKVYYKRSQIQRVFIFINLFWCQNLNRKKDWIMLSILITLQKYTTTQINVGWKKPRQNNT